METTGSKREDTNKVWDENRNKTAGETWGTSAGCLPGMVWVCSHLCWSARDSTLHQRQRCQTTTHEITAFTHTWLENRKAVRKALRMLGDASAALGSHRKLCSAHSSPCFPGGWIWSWWLWCCLDFWSRGSVGSDPTQTSSRYHPELLSSLKHKTPDHFLWPALHADGEAHISNRCRQVHNSPTCSNHWISALAGNNNVVTTRSHKNLKRD